MPLPQVHERLAADERSKLQIGGLKKLQQRPPIKIIQIQDADLASGGSDVLDNIPGAGLPDGEFVFRNVQGPCQLHERFHREGIMLGGNGELLLVQALLAVRVHQVLILAVYLAGVGQEFEPLRRERDALAAPVKDHDADFLFQLLDRAGQGRLGNIELVCRFVQGARFRNGDDIMQLLQRQQDHRLPSA